MALRNLWKVVERQNSKTDEGGVSMSPIEVLLIAKLAYLLGGFTVLFVMLAPDKFFVTPWNKLLTVVKRSTKHQSD